MNKNNENITNSKTPETKDHMSLLVKFMPSEIKENYSNYCKTISKDNTPQELYSSMQKIIEAENKYDISFFWTNYDKDKKNSNKIIHYRKLQAKKELKDISDMELLELKDTDKQISSIIDKIHDTTKIDKNIIKSNFEKLAIGYNLDFSQSSEILINGPKFVGFDESDETNLDNKSVQSKILDTFNINTIRNFKIANIKKDDKLLVFLPHNDESIKLANNFISNDKAQFEGSQLVFDKEKNYLKIAKILEKKKTIDDLEHTFKVRSAVPQSDNKYFDLHLRSFKFENLENIEHLQIDNISTNQKQEIYILGTIAHELTHLLETQNTHLFQQFKEIVCKDYLEPINYLTEYCKKQHQIYNSTISNVIKEDFAETVRIYTCNSKYLKEKSPERYNFVKEKMSFIKEDGLNLNL